MPRQRSNLVSVYVLRGGTSSPQILLLQRAAGHAFAGDWQGVHGHIEERAGEAAWQAAERELQEETGLRALAWHRLDTIEQFYNAENDTIYLVPAFVALVPSGAAVRLSDEHQAFEWLSLEVAAQRSRWETQRRSFQLIAQAAQDWPALGVGLVELNMAAVGDARRDG